jgi:hypothetical protein
MEFLQHCETLFADWKPLAVINSEEKRFAKRWAWKSTTDERIASLSLTRNEWLILLYQDIMDGVACEMHISPKVIKINKQPSTLEDCKEKIARFIHCRETWQN